MTSLPLLRSWLLLYYRMFTGAWRAWRPLSAVRRRSDSGVILGSSVASTLLDWRNCDWRKLRSAGSPFALSVLGAYCARARGGRDCGTAGQPNAQPGTAAPDRDTATYHESENTAYLCFTPSGSLNPYSCVDATHVQQRYSSTRPIGHWKLTSISEFAFQRPSPSIFSLFFVSVQARASGKNLSCGRYNCTINGV